jgi:outer membrane protein assembly factor BamB
LLAALSLGAVGQAAGKPDIAVTDIEFEVIAQGSGATRPALSESQAILGDAVRVRAVVQNVGDAPAGVFSVEFYFLEVSSQETDRIGSAAVFGLDVGQQLKPAVSLDTAGLAPGVYQIVAKADPDGFLAEDGANLCNNEIPRPACLSGEAKAGSDYALTLLRLGPNVSDVSTAVDALPECRMGPLTPGLTVSFYNVGTVPLTRRNLKVDSFYRTDLAGSFASLSPNLIVALIPSESKPGGHAEAVVTLDYDRLNTVFQKRGLRESNDIQIKIVITPLADNGTPSALSRELVLPTKRQLSSFFSPVDLWTFPQQTGCAPSAQGGPAPEGAVKVEPTVGPDGLIYYIPGPNADRLYALNSKGDELWEFRQTGSRLTSVALGRYDDVAESTILYVGSSDGHLYALKNGRSPKLESAATPVRYVVEQVDGWPVDVGAVSFSPTVSLDKARVAVASANGLFVFDESGKVKVELASKGAGSGPPVYVDKTHEVWFAAGNSVYKVAEDETVVCTIDAGSTVTTPLVANPGQSVIYFGTLRGLLFAVDAAAPKGQECKEKRSVSLNSPVRGLSVVREDAEGPDLIYVTTDDGYVRRLSFDPSSSSSTLAVEEVSELKLISIKTAPAVLVAESRVRAVLVVSWLGELRALSRNLDELLSVEIWGNADVPFAFNSGLETSLPVVNTERDPILLVGSADGYLYAFDLSQLVGK